MMHRTFWQATAVVALSVTALLPTGTGRAAGGMLLRGHFVVGHSDTEAEDSTTTTKITATLSGGGQKQKLNTNDVETDHFVATATVQKVLGDGSAQFKITFGPSTVTDNGKTTKLSMKGYYLVEHVDSSFHLMSSKTYGANTIPAALRSSLPSIRPLEYPAKPVSVGSTWTHSETQPPFSMLTEHITVTALGSLNGRPTITLHGTLSQPAQISSQGLLFSGTLNGTNDSQLYVDTNDDATTSKNALHFSGKLSGSSSGFTVKGSFSITSTGSSHPTS
ncbi:MAG TPA: hypothetical protein VHB98_01880 [Chloroflexota bacterium]|nr:hypothetical protein [Chloroflexota bacterium]